MPATIAQRCHFFLFLATFLPLVTSAAPPANISSATSLVGKSTCDGLFASAYSPTISLTGAWATDMPGWGVGLTQTGDFLFATFQLFDEQGRPTWYTSELRFLAPVTCSDGSTGYEEGFSGPVHLTTAQSANNMLPVNPTTKTVGKARFILSSSTSGTLEMMIGGKTLVQKLQRLPLTRPTGGWPGNYTSNLSWQRTFWTCGGNFCAGMMYNESMQPEISLEYADNENFLALRFNDPLDTASPSYLGPKGNTDFLGGACQIAGPLAFEGEVLVLKDAPYICTKGGKTTRNTTANVFLHFTSHGGIEGSWQSVKKDNYEDEASFAALWRYDPNYDPAHDNPDVKTNEAPLRHSKILRR